MDWDWASQKDIDRAREEIINESIDETNCKLLIMQLLMVCKRSRRFIVLLLKSDIPDKPNLIEELDAIIDLAERFLLSKESFG